MDDSSTVTNSTPSTLKRTAKGVAAVTGALAVGYGTYRIVRARRGPLKQRREELQRWLNNRFVELKDILRLSYEESEAFHKEVEDTVRLVSRMTRRLKLIKPNMRDLIEIAMEKRFLKMKARLHKILNIEDSIQLDSLHSFYEELREWLFPTEALPHEIANLRSNSSSRESNEIANAEANEERGRS